MAELTRGRWPRRGRGARAHALAALLAALALGGAGCEGCSCQRDRMVTFGLDAGTRGGPAPVEGQTRAAAGTDDAPGGFRAIAARALPAGTRRVELAGHPLELTDGDLRAILLVDVDGDGDQDAYVLHSRGASPSAAGAPVPAPGTPPASVALSLARVGPSGVTRVELGRVTAPGGCELSAARGETLAPSLVALGAHYTCPTGPASVTFVASVEAQPRLEERITLLAPAEFTPAPGTGEAGAHPAPQAGAAPDPRALPLSLALRADDTNADGAPDLVARIALGEGDAQVSVELKWLAGVSGLARERDEPEATLRTLANAAADPLARQPEVALRGALRVMALYDVLCAEGGAVRVRLGDGQGMNCPRSRGAGKAAAVIAAAHAQGGDVFEAADALARLDAPTLNVSDAERRMVTRAYARAPGPRGLRMRKLADVSGRAGLSFLDDHYVQLPGARVVPVREAALPPAGSGAATAAPANEDGGVPAEGNSAVEPTAADGVSLPPARANAGLIVDPSGRFRVSRLGRSCAAYVVELAALDPILHGPPRVAPIALRETPACAADTPAALEAEEDGGFVALGWAPQGLLLTRREELWVLPLTDEARPAGDPFLVAPGALPPAPVNGPAIQRDGARYVSAMGLGVVLHTLGPEPSVTLLRPEGWAELPGDARVRGLAIAPSSNAVVVQRGAAVYLLTW